MTAQVTLSEFYGRRQMNALSFDIGNDGGTVITPCIDGVRLPALVEHCERTHGMTDPAGGYGGLVAGAFAYGPLDIYFLGRAEPLFSAWPPGRQQPSSVTLME